MTWRVQVLSMHQRGCYCLRELGQHHLLCLLCWQALDEKTQQAMMAFYHKKQQQQQVCSTCCSRAFTMSRIAFWVHDPAHRHMQH